MIDSWRIETNLPSSEFILLFIKKMVFSISGEKIAELENYLLNKSNIYRIL